MQLASTAKPQHNHKESTDKTATTSHQTPEVKEGMQDSMPLFLQRAALSDFAPSIVQRQPLEEEEELQTMPTGDVIQRQAENEEEEEELLQKQTFGDGAIQRQIESEEEEEKQQQIQAKLTVSQPNDEYEKEADRVAETVMRKPEPGIHRKPT